MGDYTVKDLRRAQAELFPSKQKQIDVREDVLIHKANDAPRVPYLTAVATTATLAPTVPNLAMESRYTKREAWRIRLGLIYDPRTDEYRHPQTNQVFQWNGQEWCVVGGHGVVRNVISGPVTCAPNSFEYSYGWARPR